MCFSNLKFCHHFFFIFLIVDFFSWNPGCPQFSRRCNNASYYTWVSTCLYGGKLQICDLCLNAFVTSIIMYVVKQQLFTYALPYRVSTCSWSTQNDICQSIDFRIMIAVIYLLSWIILIYLVEPIASVLQLTYDTHLLFLLA